MEKILELYKNLSFFPDAWKGDEWIDSFGCHWGKDVEEYYQGFVLGCCCCGSIMDNLEYIRKGLQHIANTHIGETNDWYKKWREDGKLLFPTDESKYFFLYWCDKQGFAEHGSSVSCGWLTEKGKTVLCDLNIIKAVKDLEGKG
jgi:hypothetical protein